MSRFAVPSSSGWISAYYYVDERHRVYTDGIDLNSWNWSAEAACRDTDSDAFFLSDGESDRTWLRGICATCPVQSSCLQHALVNDEHGWWGGTSRNERRRLKRGS